MPDFDRNVTGIGALADPVRRQLYEFVCSQAEPVSRDRAAEAVGIPRHQAKFHLDRLEADGLLETDYVRLTGRTGPGAGRPAKRYRRSRQEFAVALPAREYELVARIMADAIATSYQNGTRISDALREAAAAHGTAIAEAATGRPSAEAATGRPLSAEDPTDRPSAESAADRPSAESAVGLALKALSEHGYEPRGSGSTFILANCPFHALARSHTELVCQLNHTLITALAQATAPDLLDIRLDAGENRCCVTLTTKD